MIELHGGSLIIRHNDTISPCPSVHILPGDRVQVKPFLFLSRPSLICIAIIFAIEQGVCSLYFPHLTASCPSVLTIPDNYYSVGDRIRVLLHSDGTIQVRKRYSHEPILDASILSECYHDTPLVVPSERVFRECLYTQPETDHCDLDTFTIDPSDTVDVDDAISVDVVNRTIYVHIVDIHKANLSDLERNEMKRKCSTLYLANEQTHHLLSTDRISNLSLEVGQDRYAITVRATLNLDGHVDSYGIYPSVIRVKKRYNYESVEPRVDIDWLNVVTERRSRQVDYQIDLPSVRFRILSGFVASIHTEDTNSGSHGVVAMCMILANTIVSHHLTKSIPGQIPNRFHAKLKCLPKENSTLHPHVASFIRIKKYARATYDIDQSGHFGLGINEYLHFTSPMRRYPDVIVHDLLAGYLYPHLEQECDWINTRTRQVRVLQSVYASWKIGRWVAIQPFFEIFITQVTKNGVMWFMPAVSLHGFTHISYLHPSQFWKYQDSILIGQSSFQTIQVGRNGIGHILKVDPVRFLVQLQITF